MKAVTPAWHEATMEVNYARGLDPWFACEAVGSKHGWGHTAEFDHDGEPWRAKLYAQESGIVHPGDATPTGTEIAFDVIREPRIQIEPADDLTGEAKVNAHLRPRWQGMRVENSHGQVSELSIPDAIEEGVSVRLSGANVDAGEYVALLANAAAALGINARYFEDPHPTSTVTDAARYVRLDRNASGPVHARDGPLASLGHLLEHDRSGYRKVVQNDDDERGRNRPGYYHTTTLGPRRIQEAFPSHSAPVEIKHYYAREAVSTERDHPLAHPKLEVAYQVSRWDDKIGVGADLADLREELDRVLHAVLVDAGIDPAPENNDGDPDGPGPYIEDSYFSPEVADHREPPSLNLSHVQHEQESVVIRHIADGLSPVEWESLQTLVTDGGSVSPADIAEDHGRNVGSVRRALRRIDDLVERTYGEVAVRSSYVAELLHEKVRDAREANRELADATGKALLAAERGLDERTSALLAWCASRGVDIESRGEAVESVRMGEVERGPPGKPLRPLRQRLRRALDLWTEAGHEAAALRQAEVRYRLGGDRRRAEFWRLIR
jgi:hypothetical protein